MKKMMLLILLGIFAGFNGYSQARDSLNVTKLGHLPYTPILNDIWGYADTLGNEYALVGTRTSFSIVDVTQPTNPVELVSIQGSNSTWRDIKTWDHYAYVVHDYQSGPSNGILIVDMDSLVNPRFKEFKPIVMVDTSFYFYQRAHNIWIDENGVLYAFGTNADFKTLMFDLSSDPWNPTYLGYIPGYYHHDGYARNDTLYGSAIYAGALAAYDVRFKSSPVFLSQVSSPNQFNHNCWLSDDGNYVFTTDEVQAGYIGAYDVSDVMNMTEIDRYQKYPGTDVIPHNAHVYGDFLVTSYYTAGVNILDISDPHNLFEVGFYDTSPFQGPGYNGAWGAYPYLPSGNLLVSDMEEGLFVLEPAYIPAARLTLEVYDSLTKVKLPLVEVVSVRLSDTLETDLKGLARIATLNVGPEFVILSKQGYHNDTISFNYVNGQNPLVKVAMRPLNLDIKENSIHDLWVENPIQGQIRIRSQSLLGQRVRIELVSMTGSLILSEEVELSSETLIPVDLPSGVYHIRILSDKGYFGQKLINR
ncbi:MAG: choice-of-anchor B family protein [Bacteroidota bacterium]|nr:choice-of-anchor B family protein [Bacteroidota bacterium]